MSLDQVFVVLLMMNSKHDINETMWHTWALTHNFSLPESQWKCLVLICKKNQVIKVIGIVPSYAQIFANPWKLCDYPENCYRVTDQADKTDEGKACCVE